MGGRKSSFLRKAGRTVAPSITKPFTMREMKHDNTPREVVIVLNVLVQVLKRLCEMRRIPSIFQDCHTGTKARGRRAYLFKYKFLVIAMQGKFGQKVFGITLEVINQCILAF